MQRNVLMPLPGGEMEIADDVDERMQALAGFLGVFPLRITESAGTLYGHRAFYCDGDRAYLVLTEPEADDAAEKAIQERLWAIALETTFDYFGIDASPSDVAAAMILPASTKGCPGWSMRRAASAPCPRPCSHSGTGKISLQTMTRGRNAATAISSTVCFSAGRVLPARPLCRTRSLPFTLEFRIINQNLTDRAP